MNSFELAKKERKKNEMNAKDSNLEWSPADRVDKGDASTARCCREMERCADREVRAVVWQIAPGVFVCVCVSSVTHFVGSDCVFV